MRVYLQNLIAKLEEIGESSSEHTGNSVKDRLESTELFLNLLLHRCTDAFTDIHKA